MRIAIVNDMTMAVEALRRVVLSVPGYSIAWIAMDGIEAVQKCAQDRPDLVLMDLMMPRMDGAEASRLIMQQSPCAILVVTATVEGHYSKVFEAMAAGALDAVETPVLGHAGDPSGAMPLLTKMALIHQRLARKYRKPKFDEAPSSNRVLAAGHPSTAFPLVVIGASTGGPAALAAILRALPRELAVGISVVQHVDQFFAPGMAAWLSRESGLLVQVVKPQDQPGIGCVQLAATNDHLVLNAALAYEYTVEPKDLYFRPSVDVFFKSVVRHWPGPLVGVLLTGMGSDGAQGLLSIRQAGGHTIAQDRESSIVYGMPKAAVALGAAMEILPLSAIAGGIHQALSSLPIFSPRNLHE